MVWYGIHGLRSCLSVRTQPLTATGAPSDLYHTIINDLLLHLCNYPPHMFYLRSPLMFFYDVRNVIGTKSSARRDPFIPYLPVKIKLRLKAGLLARHRQATRVTQVTDTADAGVIQTTVHVHRSNSASGCRLAKGQRAGKCRLVPVTKAEMRVGRLGTQPLLTGFCTFWTAPLPSRVRHSEIGLILQRWSCPRLGV